MILPLKYFNLFILGLILTFSSCQGQEQKPGITMEKLPEIPKEKQVTYAVHLNTRTPFELYLDDILIKSSLGGNSNNATVQLNPYLLANGKHQLKIRFYPRIGETLLVPEHIIFSKDSRWNIYFIELHKDAQAPLGYSNEIDYQNSALPIELPPEPVPFWEQSWEVNVDKLPYELEGWKNSQDLSKMNQEKLEQEVLLYHEKLRNMLNEGHLTEFISLKKNVDQDIITSTYGEDINWYTSDQRVENLKKCIGNMLPINNYEMRLFAHGKLVTLLIPNGELKNWGVLISKTPKGRRNYYRLLLHKPKGSNEFEIIRK